MSTDETGPKPRDFIERVVPIGDGEHINVRQMVGGRAEQNQRVLQNILDPPPERVRRPCKPGLCCYCSGANPRLLSEKRCCQCGLTAEEATKAGARPKRREDE